MLRHSNLPLNTNDMKILFEQKKPGRKSPNIEPVAVELDCCPSTVGELISSTARSLVATFNRRASSASVDMDTDNQTVCPLSDEEISNLAETGRVAFGIVYNGREEDPEKAASNALQSYEDGIFRIFINGNDAGCADNPIRLVDSDLVTVVRLTLLSGRMW